MFTVSRNFYPFIDNTFADSGYAGERVATASAIAVEIVRKKPDRVSFAVHPRRWVVERFFAWISRNRRLRKDTEATIESATAFLYAASVLILIRRLAQKTVSFKTDSKMDQFNWGGALSGPGTAGDDA